MTLCDAMVYVLASSGYGMNAQRLAGVINREGLHRRKDGQPVTDRQIYAIMMQHRHVFTFEDGVIRLLM